MKIILSHDVDHLYWTEHWFRDLFIPKVIYRSGNQWIKGLISTKELIGRIGFWKNRLNRLSELTDFLDSKELNATFFFGMANGLGLSYPSSSAKSFIHELLERGHDVGVHGIDFENLEKMKEERDRFLSLSKCSSEGLGVRMHYLRMNDKTLANLGKLNYLYDSTVYGVMDPYKTDNGVWEFPISIMESYAISPQTQDLDQAKKYSLNRINEAREKGLAYFTINFHDVHFDDAYYAYKNWFIWIVNLFLDQGYEFTNFEAAINEIGHAY